jgi:hypothetical protein
MPQQSRTYRPTVEGAVMLKKIISVVVVGALAKYALDKLTGSKNDDDLWAEATDPIKPGS